MGIWSWVRPKLFLIVLIPVFAFAVIVRDDLVSLEATVADCATVRNVASVAWAAGTLVHELQKERGRSAGFLGGKGAEFLGELATQRAATDAAWRMLRDKLGDLRRPELEAPVGDISRDMAGIVELRGAVDARTAPLGDILERYTATVGVLLTLYDRVAVLSPDPGLQRHILALGHFARWEDALGLERAILNNAFAANRFAPGMYERLVSVTTRQEAHREAFERLATPEEIAAVRAILEGPEVGEALRLRAIASENAGTGTLDVDPLRWFEVMTRRIDLMNTFESRLSAAVLRDAQAISESAEREETHRKRLIALVVGSILLVMLIAGAGANWERKSRLHSSRAQRVESELRESERRFQSLFEQLEAAVIIMRGGRAIDCNPSALRLLGMSGREDILGKTPLDFSPEFQPDGTPSEDAVRGHIRRVLGGEALVFEWQNLRLDGTRFDAEISLSAIQLGEEPLIQCIMSDISERKGMEQERARLLRALGERVKELRCLQGLNALLLERSLSISQMLERALALLLPAFLHPEACAARLSWAGIEWRAGRPERPRSSLSVEIFVGGPVEGYLEVAYVEDVAGMSADPFLEGERSLLRIFAERIGGYLLRRRTEQALQESEATFRRLFEDSSDAILLIDGTGVFVECNQAALELLKMTREQFLNLPPSAISPEFQPDGRRSSESAQEMIALAYARGLHRFDWTCVDSEGCEFIVDVSLMPLSIRGQTMLHTSWRDITDRKRMERELQAALQRVRELTLRDPLTGAFNRRHLEQVLSLELSAAQRRGNPLSVAMFDIDHFKAVNDTHGHGAGDVVLRSIAETISRAIRPGDVLARYGGEEFALVMRDTTASEATVLAERLRSTIQSAPIETPEVVIRVTLSSGIASLSDCAEPTEDGLLRSADERLYRAKALGRNRVVGPDRG